MHEHAYHGPTIPDATPATAPTPYATTQPQRSMDTDRAGELLGTSGRQVRRLIAAGELKAFRLGRVLRVTEQAIVEFQSRNEVRSAA